MKKLLAMVLILTLVLSMGALAFAVDVGNQFSLDKSYKLANSGTTSPEETFIFGIESIGVTDSQYTDENMPGFEDQQLRIEFLEGGANDSGAINSGTLILPVYEHVGMFTYKLTEIDGNTAGVTYDEGKFMKVQVYNEGDGFGYAITLHEINGDGRVGDKVESFENKFSAGDLEIKKLVTGNMGEKDRIFNVTLTLTAPEGKNMTKVPITVKGIESYYDFTDGSETLELEFSEGNPITINNLPFGVSWNVEEEDLTGEGYDAAIYSASYGTIEEPSEEVTITNHKFQDINTGINLDNLPYVLILVGAAAGLAAFTMKKRPSSDE